MDRMQKNKSYCATKTEVRALLKRRKSGSIQVLDENHLTFIKDKKMPAGCL